MFCKTTALTLAISAWKKDRYKLKASTVRENTFSPLFYIRLGMMNHFVEAMYHDGKTFQYHQLKFPKTHVRV